jgi:hypothetical protein
MATNDDRGADVKQQGGLFHETHLAKPRPRVHARDDLCVSIRALTTTSLAPEMPTCRSCLAKSCRKGNQECAHVD